MKLRFRALALIMFSSFIAVGCSTAAKSGRNPSSLEWGRYECAVDRDTLYLNFGMDYLYVLDSSGEWLFPNRDADTFGKKHAESFYRKEREEFTNFGVNVYDYQSRKRSPNSNSQYVGAALIEFSEALDRFPKKVSVTLDGDFVYRKFDRGDKFECVLVEKGRREPEGKGV